MSKKDETTMTMSVNGGPESAPFTGKDLDRAARKLKVDLDQVDHLKLLESLNRQWFGVMANKASAVAAFNKELKGIEGDINALLGELADDRDRLQPRLPMESGEEARQ